ncbi:hypothetical protein L6452_41061 [Arctium lappa]|uniref:Uncharacterized protein n=1 Tax=Arctium lappa TaxID=4217 RepID=A0ACB8XPE6_ARCLA|nr:hypothetical protein L6452_41061 [Arctium lappa]
MIYDLKESLQPLITFTVISLVLMEFSYLDLIYWDFKVPVEDGDELRGVGVSFPTAHDDVTLKINPSRCSLSGHGVEADKVILREMMCSVETPSG